MDANCIAILLQDYAQKSWLSRPGEKFLIEPSRKFLLTAARLKDGTNRDEPRGTGLAGLVETGAGREDDAAGRGRANGRDRALGTQAVAADEETGRCGCRAWAAGTGIEPQAGRENAEAGAGDPAQAGLARFRADLCRRTTGQTSPDSGRKRNAARVDDRGRHVAAGFAQDSGRAWLAAAARRIRR